MKLSRWTRATLLTGIILLGLGIIPLWLTSTFLPAGAPVIFAMGFYLLAPMGTVVFIIGLILFLVAMIRR